VTREPAESLESFRAAISSAASRASWLRAVEVLAEVGSTMDAAADRPVGTFLLALRQTQGRGRLGRRWIDDGGGVACTAVAPPGDPREVSIRAAVAAAEALDGWLGVGVARLKFPNDLMVGERKIGGILIVRDDRRALVGVGINVRQQRFDEDLAPTATSLAIEDAAPRSAPRERVAAALLAAIDRWMLAPFALVREAWRSRDWLRGRLSRWQVGDEELAGRVVSIDPVEWIELDLGSGVRRIPAAGATLLDFARKESGPTGVARSMDGG